MEIEGVQFTMLQQRLIIPLYSISIYYIGYFLFKNILKLYNLKKIIFDINILK